MPLLGWYEARRIRGRGGQWINTFAGSRYSSNSMATEEKKSPNLQTPPSSLQDPHPTPKKSLAALHPLFFHPSHHHPHLPSSPPFTTPQFPPHTRIHHHGTSTPPFKPTRNRLTSTLPSQVQGHHGVPFATSKPSYTTYKSPYGPKYPRLSPPPPNLLQPLPCRESARQVVERSDRWYTSANDKP